MISKTMLCFTLALTFALPAQAIGPDETDARKIMEAVDARKTPKSQTGKMAMLVVDDVGRKRKRLVESRMADFGSESRQFIKFVAPADVQGTALLSYDYDDGDKTDDQWLYLPSLRKSTRISSGDKSGSFMGTDMSYSDMTKKDPKDYTYKLLQQSAEVAGEDCWLIEATPKTQKEKDETGYIKLNSWVSKSKLMPIQIKSWIRDGKKLKYIKFSDIKEIKGYNVAHRIKAWTKRGDSTLSTTTIVFRDQKVDESQFAKDSFNQSLFGK